jgi:hypothetical protein
MLIHFEASPDVHVLQRALMQFNADAACHSLLLLSCDANHYPLELLNPLLHSLTKPIIGGIFPQILHEQSASETGFVLVGLPYTLEVKTIPHLSDSEQDYEEAIATECADLTETDTLLVFVDGLAKRIASLVDGLFANFGTATRYIGGGAGSLSFVQSPCLISNQGVIADAALIGVLSTTSRLAVGHGWQTIVPDLQVTRVDRNIIQEINYCNAFDFYAMHINQHSQQEITPQNFFEIAQSFPFGINKLDGEKIVRDPIAVTEEGYLVCVGELSQGDFVDLLSADAPSLIQAAQHTANLAMAQLANHDADYQFTLFIDCISRALFLKTRFNEEVAAVRQTTGEDKPLVGALVLGEIANSGTGYLEFYNKTSVVALIGD